MLTIVYRFYLQEHQIQDYQHAWQTVASFFKQHRGAIDSNLYQSEDGLWVVISQWPDKKTWQDSWDEDIPVKESYPKTVQKALKAMQKIKDENQHLPTFSPLILPLKIS